MSGECVCLSEYIHMCECECVCVCVCVCARMRVSECVHVRIFVCEYVNSRGAEAVGKEHHNKQYGAGKQEHLYPIDPVYKVLPDPQLYGLEQLHDQSYYTGDYNHCSC